MRENKMSKDQININNKYDRIVVLIDMDCFYCQVEEKLDPELKGKPIAVVQYNAWRGGGIIAVNYPARDKGVTRHMRGDEAKAACPDIELVKVPNIREKADLSKYREAGKEVAEVLQSFTTLLERASVDEAYLDITEQVQRRLVDMNEGKFQLRPETLQSTYALGFNSIGEFVQDISAQIGKKVSDDDDASVAHVPPDDRKAYRKSDIKLLVGSSIVNEIRAAVKAQTGYECAAGIAHNKLLAKLVCGMNKPNKQMILPLRHIDEMYRQLPLRKVKGLGGKFGEELCEQLAIQNMIDLKRFSKEELQKRYDERNGQWLYLIARGIDLEAVTPRFAPKSIACCKKFPGRNAIGGVATLNHWLRELSKEISERLEKDELEYNRRPRQLVVSYMQTIGGSDVSSSRSAPLACATAVDDEKLAVEALDVLKKNTEKFLKSDNCNALNNPIKFLGISVSKFESTEAKTGNTIQNMFRKNIEAQAAAHCAYKENESAERDIRAEREDSVTTVGGERPVLISKNDWATSNALAANADGAIPEKTGDIKSFFSKYRKSLSPVPFATTSENSANSSTASIDVPTMNQIAPNSITQPNSNQNSSESMHTVETNQEPSSAVRSAIDETASSAADCEAVGEVIDNREQQHSYTHSTSLASVSDEQQPLQSHSAHTADYTQTYAEFQRPGQLEVPTINCSQCNQPVKITEMQTHADAHLAYQLSQEQRQEFRSQLKSNVKTAAISSPAAKRMRTGAKSAPTASTATSLHGISSIDRFLIRRKEPAGGDQAPPKQPANVESAEPEPSTSNGPSIELELCAECHKRIPVTEMGEHSDYHMAKKLQWELQQVERNTLNSSKGDISNNNVKDTAKSKKKGSGVRSKSTNSKSVASFFSK